MKVRVNNKKVFILMLIILLLILAVGYAVFSEILTISGTANAKGTFDLEFQNAEVVKNIGADKEKTTAEISADKNTLTVNVGDLAYPGAGVEFSVDIVNVGTMPAEVQAVTPNNITGSDKIKVTGLDGIKVGHPKIEVEDRCNIHFTVEWPIDVTEIGEDESSISFGLQIEYTQATGETFDGQASHIDTNKSGNTITNTTTGGEIEEPKVREGKLTEIVEPEDYGKSINYKATVKGQEVNEWKVLYNDKNNVYLIVNDCIPNNLVASETGLNKSETYEINSQNNRDELLNGLNTKSYWSEFANGVEGATATGAPSLDILMKSYNEKYNTSFNTDSTVSGGYKIDSTDTLYMPHTSNYNGIEFYWLADPYPTAPLRVWQIHYITSSVTNGNYNYVKVGVRPVVKLPGAVEGIIDDTIEIK